MGTIQQLMEERRKKLKALRDLGINPYPYGYESRHHAGTLLDGFDKLSKKKTVVKAAGRIMSLRRMGKASFAHIEDHTGKIQLYFKKDTLKKSYDLLKLLDIGDFIGASGTMFRTRTGEVTLEVKELTILSKSLRPLPEKWHGLKDTEIRYRKRSVDLVMDPKVREVFRTRSRIISGMRAFLDAADFLEVETPTLQTIYGGAAARPFITHHNTLDIDLYLRISNELYLKRLIVGGFEKVYEFVKDFRNEGIDRTHNPEFTMMECYWAYADYNDMMRLTEDMMSTISLDLFNTTKHVFQGKKIDFKPPWKRLPMITAIKKYAGFDVKKMSDKELFAEVKSLGHELEEQKRGLAIAALFEELVEEHLTGPVFITDYPKETTPLAKAHRKDPSLIERFEPYVAGWEMGNAYSELNDPVLQRKLLEEQAKSLASGHEESHPMDEDFCQALEVGMPPTGGLGLGIDRWVMVFTDQPSIRDVIFFPTMKPK